MYKEERRQKSFYNAVYEAGVPEGHFLWRLEELIDLVWVRVIAVNLKRMVRLVYGEARWEMV